jgi:hypothetical protein
MMKNLLFFLLLTTTLALTNQVRAAIFMIGDNDGYGIGIPDGGKLTNPPFDFSNANNDFRSDAEKLATNGAQFTDTYSTTQPGFSPQAGTVATFTFSGLGGGWTKAALEFDLADFQATGFGSVKVDFNGEPQDWSFDDNSPNTKIRTFDLPLAVIANINSTGVLTVTIDRAGSLDFYGFDYVKLTDAPASVPVPAAVWLFGSAILGMGSFVRRKQAPSA